MYEIIKPGTRYDFMKAKKKAFLLSGTLIVLSMIILITNTFVRGKMLNYGIDFLGGTQIQVKIKPAPTPAEVRKALEKYGYKHFTVVSFDTKDKFMIRMREFSSLSSDKRETLRKVFKNKYGNNLFRIRFSESGDHLKIRFHKPVSIKEFTAIFSSLGIKAKIPEPKLSQEANAYLSQKKNGKNPKWTKEHSPELDYADSADISAMRNEYTITLESIGEKLESQLAKALGKKVDILSVESRGPQVGKRLRINGILSLLYALGFILLYIVLRFDTKFAPGAIVALIHDVFITVGIFALFWREFSLPILAALLTIVGYSLNDTIVVYDRIRENINKMGTKSLTKIINISINETLSRTLLTSLTTFLTVLAIFIMATGVLKDFALAMGIGIIVGTYSSVFVASPIVIWIDNKLSLYSSSNKAAPSSKEFEPIVYDEEIAQLTGKAKTDNQSENDDDTTSESDSKAQKIKKIKKMRKKPKGGRRGRR